MAWRGILSIREVGRSAFAVALLALVLLPALFVLRLTHNQPFSIKAIETQAKIMRGELPLRTAINPSELREWQIRAVGKKFAPMQFDASSMGLWPTGGLVKDIEGRQIVVTVYRGRGASITCFTFLGTEEDAPKDASVFFDQLSTIKFYIFSRNGEIAVLHREGNVICLLVSTRPAQELLELARKSAGT